MQEFYLDDQRVSHAMIYLVTQRSIDDERRRHAVSV